MSVITEKMSYLQKLCKYDLKYRVTKTARHYHTNRQFVYRQLKNITVMLEVYLLNQENLKIVQILITRDKYKKN